MTRQPTIDVITRIARQIKKHSDWELCASDKELSHQIDTIVSSDQKTVETLCCSVHSSAQLQLEIPHPEKDALLQLELENPLDPNLPYLDSSFANQIAQTNEGIGERHTTEYTEPQRHSSIILQGCIPYNYDPASFANTLTVCSRAARCTERCHTHIKNTLRVYAEG